MADTLVCSIELSKIDGITVTVKNAAGKITQTVVMNGTSITTTVKGDQSTSTIIQDAESFLFKVAGPQETSTKLNSSVALTASATGNAKLSELNATIEGSSNFITKGGLSAELSAGKVVMFDTSELSGSRLYLYYRAG